MPTMRQVSGYGWVGDGEGVADGVAVGKVAVGECLVDDDGFEGGVGVGGVDGAATEEGDVESFKVAGGDAVEPSVDVFVGCGGACR